MSEDKMREWDEGFAACAAIKDAEIAELESSIDQQRTRIIELYEERDAWRRESASRDLVIKELRRVMELACIGACNCLTKTPDYRYHKSNCIYGVLQQALAKSEHHNSSALEKMLLEARIDESNISTTLSDYALSMRVMNLKEKLAELNKEHTNEI